jgi:hypothetical protein
MNATAVKIAVKGIKVEGLVVGIAVVGIAVVGIVVVGITVVELAVEVKDLLSRVRPCSHRSGLVAYDM